MTIVEFSDFQCPYCSKGAKTVEQIIEKYPNDVKFVFKHFPLNNHSWAKAAAIASHQAEKDTFQPSCPMIIIDQLKRYRAEVGSAG